MSRIKAIILDVDGTLYHSREYERHLYRAIVEVLSIFLRVSPQEAAEMLRKQKTVYRTVSKSVEALGIDRRKFYELLAERAEPSKYIAENPLASKVLRELRERGYRVALHTNSGRRLAEKVLEAVGIDESCYDILVTSDDAEPKPSLEGYRKCLKLLGIRPEEALYVGDRPEVELKPAKELGMQTALINNNVEEKPGHVDYLLRSLDDILNILSS